MFFGYENTSWAQVLPSRPSLEKGQSEQIARAGTVSRAKFGLTSHGNICTGDHRAGQEL